MADPVVRAALRSAIVAALVGVGPPIDLLIDAVIVPYAADRSSTVRYYRASSDRYAADIRRLTDLKQTDDAIATMVRYPSFVSASWLDSVRRRSDTFRYVSIDYRRRYDLYFSFDVSIDAGWTDSTTRFGGCPNSSQFWMFNEAYCNRSANFPEFIQTVVSTEMLPMLTDFARTGRCDVDDLLAYAETIQEEPMTVRLLLPVVHAYYRLTELVRRGICLQTEAVCDGCRTKTNPPAVVSTATNLRPFPAELYDDDDD